MDENIQYILIVDDNENNLRALQKSLVDVTADIHTACSGNDALSMMLRTQYSVVLVDVNMPGMNGYELVQLMRDIPESQNIPVIFITGNTSAEFDMQDGFQLSAIDFIIKPVDINVLTSKINTLTKLQLSTAAEN